MPTLAAPLLEKLTLMPTSCDNWFNRVSRWSSIAGGCALKVAFCDKPALTCAIWLAKVLI